MRPGAVAISQSEGVLLRPVQGALLLATVLSVGMLAGIGVTGPEELPTVIVLLMVLLFPAFLAYGGARAYLWRRRAGDVSWEVSDDGIRVLRSGLVVEAVTWEQVLTLKVEGRYGWYELLTAQPVDEFPRLVITTEHGTLRTPPILLWGSEAADADRQVRELRVTAQRGRPGAGE